MGLKVILMLGSQGPPLEPSRYAFGNWLSKPTMMSGVALFRWICAEHTIPDELIILGTQKSDWAGLSELVLLRRDHPRFAELALERAVWEGSTTQELLEELGTLLEDYLGEVKVRCRLIETGMGFKHQLGFFMLLSSCVAPGDEVHVHVDHEMWTSALTASACSSFVTLSGEVDVLGIHVPERAMASPAGIPVMTLSKVNALVEWSSALALFRQSGLIGTIPELLRDEAPELADAIQELSFAITMYQYEDLAQKFARAKRLIGKLLSQRRATLGTFFTRQFVHETEWLDSVHIAGWQMEFARRSLHARDYLRAVSMMQEAVISAAIREEEERFDMGYRQYVALFLAQNRSKTEIFPIDPWPFFQTYEIKQALLSPSMHQEEATKRLISKEEHLRSYLERALSFTAALIERFHRIPPC